jgi:hypothetical protein
MIARSAVGGDFSRRTSPCDGQSSGAWQPKLASRVRLLQAGDVNKNDPSDALSVAVAALRSMSRRQVTADDCAPVLMAREGGSGEADMQSTNLTAC